MSSMGQVDITKALTRQRGTNQGGGKGNFTCHTRRILVMRLKEFSLLRLCCAAVLGLKTNQRNLRTSHKLHLNFVLIDIHRGGGGGGAKEVVKQRKCKKRASSSSNSVSIGMTPLAAAVVPVAIFFALLYCSLFLSLSHSPSLSLPLPVSL